MHSVRVIPPSCCNSMRKFLHGEKVYKIMDLSFDIMTLGIQHDLVTIQGSLFTQRILYVSLFIFP